MSNEEMAMLQKILDKVESLDAKVSGLETQTQENTQILRALREHSEVNKAEHDAMKMDMAYMMGDIKSLKNSMCAVENATAYNWGEIAKLKKAQ